MVQYRRICSRKEYAASVDRQKRELEAMRKSHAADMAGAHAHFRCNKDNILYQNFVI